MGIETVDPRDASGLNDLGLTLAAQGRFDDAIERYRKAAALWETTGSSDRKLALCNWAEALGSKNLYEESAKKYGEAIAIDPNHAPAYNGLGLALAGQERFDDAIEQYRKAVALWESTGSLDRKLALCNWAEALDSKNRYEESAKKYGEAIAIDANFALAYNGLGFALLGQERFDEAIEQCRKAAALWESSGSPDRKFALRYWAKALRLKKLYEESAKKCGEAIAVDVNFALAYNDLGRALAGQERFDDAIEQYRKAVALLESTGSPDRKFALLYWAGALVSKKLYEEAAKKCGEAVAVDPKFAPAYNGLGIALTGQKRFNEAIEQYRQAAALWETTGSPDRKFALYTWADALVSKKLYEEAAKKFGEAVAVDPKFAPAYNGLGIALMGQKRFNEAIEQYRQAAALWETTGSPDRKFALYTWADALVSTKLYEEAAKKCSEAIAIDPKFADAHNCLGIALAGQERFDEAIEQFCKAAALWETTGSPDRKFALYTWARALVSKKLYEEAAKKCGEAIAIDPKFADAHNGLGIALAGQERYDEAIEQYRKADGLWENAKSDDRKFALWNLGMAFLQQDRFDDAIANFAQATTVAPDDAMAFFYCGLGLTACWRYRDGIAQFEHAALLDRSNPDPHHNKAYALFALGRYEEGWKEWWITRDRYENLVPMELRNEEDSEKALHFADLLREVFSEYAKSEEYYQRVIRRRGDNASAWTGLAILYQQWAESEGAPSEIRARLTYAIHRAKELLRSQLGKGERLQTLLSLADLQIEIRDWPEARQSLALAESFCRESRLKRAEIANRLGLVCHGADEHTEAVKHLR